MIDGYRLSEIIGIGDTLDFVNYWLKRYRKTGDLPKKSLELWICLFGLQRREHFTGYPTEFEQEYSLFLKKAYSQLRTNLLSIEGVKDMLKNYNTRPNDRFRSELIQRYWLYQENRFPLVDEFFDQNNQDFRRPPVFLPGKIHSNILTSPDSTPQENKRLFDLIPKGEHHRWYRSMNSSQALALSVLGNLFLENQLSILGVLRSDDGELLINQSIQYDEFCLEHKIDYLGEKRKTSIDAFIPGEFQIAIECKFTEKEIGKCSRPGVAKTNTKYEQLHCDGSYIQRDGHQGKCPLVASGVRYWELIPHFLNWDIQKDEEQCKLRYNYQLIRNILAAGCGKDRIPSPLNGQVILIYDSRNPSCQPGGKIYKSFYEVKEALLVPQMLKRVSWQNIIYHMRKGKVLPWLTQQLEEKYGI